MTNLTEIHRKKWTQPELILKEYWKENSADPMEKPPEHWSGLGTIVTIGIKRHEVDMHGKKLGTFGDYVPIPKAMIPDLIQQLKQLINSPL